MRDEDSRNLILAIVLSVIVFVGWTYFYAAPQAQREADLAAQQQAAQAVDPARPNLPLPSDGGVAPGAPTQTVAPGTNLPATREAAIAAAPRIPISTPSKEGSINLRGARIDDLILKDYQETTDPDSDPIVLLSPSNSANPYYAEFGWVGGGEVPGGLPDSQTVWQTNDEALTPATPVTLTFVNEAGLTFERTITVDEDALFTVEDRVLNETGAPVTLYPYGLVSRHGVPNVMGYFVLHEGFIGVLGEEGLQEWGYDDVAEAERLSANVTGESWAAETGGWVGITDKYWATAIVPDQDTAFTGRFTSEASGGSPVFQADALGAARTLAAGEELVSTKRLFAGAKEVDVVDGYAEAFDIRQFDLLIDWGWFYFITKPMFYALDFFFTMFGNFGVAILIVTVILKLFFLPLANKSYASMAKMKAVQPEMMAIRDRYGDDRMKQQQELMELYKREKINPVAGCWPVLIQIPVFFALYKVLFVTIEMRHAPFFGWIQDLAAPDPTSIFNLFGLIPWETPALLTVGIWPILMGVTMFVQMKMNPEPPDPVQKAVFTWMPVIFTFMLASFPAGLVIYWAWNNLLSVLQQGFIMRRHGVKIELWDNIKKMLGAGRAAAKG
ncbi:membrane protein insertase YidC [Salinarimonas ramus]|uniref:Membrane protein insertase YidC n=1 Tax=Salinarimonas ramus TaxID=690164 RepID=A0A917Q5J0_9HYPH|nr:membrane protein insertase YidC [Salinarimonas ramus]GGK24136.1 membrane protein insertase YidC [Salinarimonas ramus]